MTSYCKDCEYNNLNYNCCMGVPDCNECKFIMSSWEFCRGCEGMSCTNECLFKPEEEL